MPNHQTIEKLHVFCLTGIHDRYRKQMENTIWRPRASRRWWISAGLSGKSAHARLLKKSKLNAKPLVEDIGFVYPCELDLPLMFNPIISQLVAQHVPVLFTGPHGIGKSWLVHALA
jgi:hypothetical protein